MCFFFSVKLFLYQSFYLCIGLILPNKIGTPKIRLTRLSESTYRGVQSLRIPNLKAYCIIGLNYAKIWVAHIQRCLPKKSIITFLLYLSITNIFVFSSKFCFFCKLMKKVGFSIEKKILFQNTNYSPQE